MNETDKDKLILDLFQVIRVYRATAADTRRLIGKRQAYRVKARLPLDELLEEVAVLNHDAVVSERAIQCDWIKSREDYELRAKWLGTTPQYVE